MLKNIFFVFLLFTSVINAQHSVKGKMEPISNFKWVVLYQLQGAKQNYITNTKVTNGEFNLIIPEKSSTGIYRLLYDLENRLFVDFIYDNENVTLTFNPKYPNQSTVFKESVNNKLFHSYLKATALPQQKLDSLQVEYFNSTDKTEQENIVKSYYLFYVKLKTNQANFENQSNEKLVNHFIKASARYNAAKPIKNSFRLFSLHKNSFFR